MKKNNSLVVTVIILLYLVNSVLVTAISGFSGTIEALMNTFNSAVIFRVIFTLAGLLGVVGSLVIWYAYYKYSGDE